MNSNRYGVALLMIGMILAGIFAWLLRLASQGSSLATCFAALLLIPALPFAFYAMLYAIVLPFGYINHLLDIHSEEVQSPFAKDRLPEQQIQPSNDPERAF